MKIHHIGYLVKNIETSLSDFKKLNYKEISNKVLDEHRNVFIQFIQNGEYVVELIAPYNESSPIKNLLTKMGSSPYHLCYEVEKIEDTIKNLIVDGYTIIEEPNKAIAINNKRVTFLYKKNIGIIELVEK